MAILKTDYKDDILDTSQNTKRKYAMTENQDDTVSFDDETEYTQEGDSFGAQDINATNAQVNTNTSAIQGINDNLTNKLNKDWIRIVDTMNDSYTTIDFNESDYSELLLVSVKNNSTLGISADLYPIQLYKDGFILYGNAGNVSCGEVVRVSATQLKYKHNNAATYADRFIVFAR